MGDIIDHCPIAFSMDILGGKWSLPLIWLINGCPNIRYGQIKKVFPVITNTALTRALQQLEEYKIIKRTDFKENPPRVDYTLTERGNQLIPIVNSLSKFGEILMNEENKKPYYPNINKILNLEVKNENK